MSEADIQARILLACGAMPGVRLFRNTVGEGWQGKKIDIRDAVRLPRSDTVTLLRPRYVTFGLGPDTSDLIGWAHGRFFAVEVKDEKGIIRKGQQRFVDAVNSNGGIAGIGRSPEDVLRLLL